MARVAETLPCELSAARTATQQRLAQGTGVVELRLGDDAAGYLFLTPWLIGFFVLTAGPMLYSLYLAFTN